jgi:general secretion pathway protein D
MDRIIATVAKKAGKKFVLDPRVRGDIVLIGQEPANVSYNDLLTILAVHGYIAVETGGYVEVLPDANARQVPLPVITGKESYPDSEFVSKVIKVKNVSAAQLVPILRPILPQNAHLAAYPYSNQLLLVDSYANVKRLQTIIEALDVGEPYKPEKCEDPVKPSPK